MYKPVLVLSACVVLSTAAGGAGLRDEARQLELKGEAVAARSLLERAVRSAPRNVESLVSYAEFLESHGDPQARDMYARALAILRQSGPAQERGRIARKLVLLSLAADDRAAAERYVEECRAAGIQNVRLPDQPTRSSENPVIEIPGPLRSFARMAALSPDLAPDDLLGALARNVVTNGYQASSSNEALEQTEYLKLVVRYLSQARELARIAGSSQTIRIETCESSQTGDLLRVLGYRMRGGCGSEVVLETVNAMRAFITIDSGFPIAELEQALRTSRPFTYDFKPTQVPVLFGSEYWLSAREKQSGDFIDAYLADPSLCRLYLGLSKLDRETADELKKAIPVQRIKAFAHVLDFFGGMFQITNGKVIPPGAPRTVAMWTELVGAPPDQGAAFIEKLISKDDGWMASFFDALARINGPVKDYLTEPNRMKRFYLAIRGRVTSPGPARPVFRSNTDMLLLTTRFRLEADGKPHIPGGVDVWKSLFTNHPHGKYDGKLTRAAAGWKEPDDVIEALFALCRKAVENEPLKIFMAISDLNRNRREPLQPATVDRLARQYRGLGSQYPIFNEAPSISDQTVIAFLDTAEAISDMRDQALRADTAGTLQALVGLWQIFYRQGAISPDRADSILSEIVSGFPKIRNNRELFDSGRAGVKTLLKATASPDEVSPQDRFMDLLAGTARADDSESHKVLVQDMIRVFEAQRLVSLKTLFDLADHLESLSRGEKLNTALVNRLASRVADIQLPRAALSSVEKNAFAFGYWTERHVEQQRKLNIRTAVERAGADPERLKDVRGQLAPILRDTLVGLNYVHYAPPGAQVLLTNPLFVRSHDFLGVQGANQTWRTTEVFGTGWPSSAGGRLVGSLASLPYALAEAEQNFLIPTREQALIWGDLVPQIILSAKVPRWWDVTPAQVHWLALHMRVGEYLIAESALDARSRQRVVEVLERQVPPARARRIARSLEEGRVKAALDSVMPSELYVLAVETLSADKEAGGSLGAEIRALATAHSDRLNYAVISRAFGTPKPTLANSYRPELLNLRTFPTLMGYSSRILAESWESSLLYYAALADEVHLNPSQLNLLIPEWTQKTIERIFATHLEDWPALLRSLRLVGEDVRVGARKQFAAEEKASLN
jgi:hypothetical protein